MSVAMKAASDTFNNVASLRDRVAVSDRREAVLLANSWAFFGQIARATAEFCKARDTIST